MSCSCINVGSNLAPFSQPWTPRILQKWGVSLDSMECNPWQNGFSYRISFQEWFLVDFRPSTTWLKMLQDGSKTVSRRFQDGSRRLWTLPRRAPTQSTFGKKRFSVDNAQWTDQSPQSIVHSSPFTVSYSQFIICKSEFLVQHLQFTVDDSRVTLPCPPHFTKRKIRTHKQKNTTFALKQLLLSIELKYQIKIPSTTKRTACAASSLYRQSRPT